MTDPRSGGLRSAGAWALVAVLLVIGGVALRLYRFPAVPAGVHQDEAAAAYEAYSLLETGKDRWGNRLPPYFPAWGSGQSVLLSYLSVPFVAAGGLSAAAVRLPALLAGFATLGLFFLTVRRVASGSAALVALALLALAPWHVMLSRWGLDANLLPFTLLLGTYTLTRAVASESRLVHLLSLLPFALTFYSYGIAVLITPLYVLLLGLLYRRELATHPGRYIPSALVALLLSAPFALFLVKDRIVKRALGSEAWLPFDLPVLPASRLGQGPSPAIPTSAHFLLAGLRDDLVWNNLPDVAPLPGGLLLAALVGLALVMLEWRRGEGRDPFAAWLLSCVPLLAVVPVNVTRANALYLPLIALAARAIVAVDGALPGRLRTAGRVAAVVWLALGTIHFAAHYFRAFPRLGAVAFNRELGRAVTTAVAGARAGETVYVTEAVPLNYVYFLFYARVPPAEFQANAVYHARPGRGYEVERLGRACFLRERLKLAEPVVSVLRATEDSLCPEPEVLFKDKWWRVDRCQVSPRAP